MKKSIFEYCRFCEPCQFRNQVPKLKLAEKVVAYERPNECLAVDKCGKINPPSGKYCYILGVIDCFSRFATLISLEDYKYETVLKKLYGKVFYIHGPPKKIRIDGAGNFKNAMLLKALKDTGIEISATIHYYSKSNSLIERLFKQVQNCISKYKKYEWAEMLEPFMCFRNTTVHKSTGQMPYYLHYLRYPTKGIGRFVNSRNPNRVDVDLPAEKLKEYAKKTFQETAKVI